MLLLKQLSVRHANARSAHSVITLHEFACLVTRNALSSRCLADLHASSDMRVQGVKG